MSENKHAKEIAYPFELILCSADTKVVQDHIPLGISEFGWFVNELLGSRDLSRVFGVGVRAIARGRVIRSFIAKVVDNLRR